MVFFTNFPSPKLLYNLPKIDSITRSSRNNMKQKEKIIETFSEMAPRYEEIVNHELTRFWGLSYQEFITALIDSSPIQKDAIILDIATGTGMIPIRLINNTGNHKTIHGLDITHSMLIQANRNFRKNNHQEIVKLTCASAMEMPYSSMSFDYVFCGLATHHMNVKLLTNEVYRILRLGGQISFADVGSTQLWKYPGVKWIIRLLAFVYYLTKEGANRAWAESSAVSNVLTAEEWFSVLSDLNFKKISIKKMKSKYIWIPSPLVIRAEKF